MYVKEINDEFEGQRNIMLDSNKLNIGKQISNDRKKLIYEIYNMFGNLSSLKIREIIFSNESPLEFIYDIPEVLYMYIFFSIGVPKNMTKQWFEDNFLEIN